MENENFIEFHNISKIFPGVKALDNISFNIKRGEIHALVGENGAGKSTLINICSGVLTPNDGFIVINGNKVKISNPKAAEDFKIATAFQEVPICPYMSIAQNIFLGPAPVSKFGLLNEKFMNKKTAELLNMFDIRRHPKDRMGKLSISEQSMIQILRVLNTEPYFIILDEPTSSLSYEQKDILFTVLNKIRGERELTVLYVSHRLEEIFEITNRITVLKDGKFITTLNTNETEIDSIINLMVGRNIDKNSMRKKKSIGSVILEAKDISRLGVLENISFKLRKGEILGIAGLQGAGRTELGRAVFGADKIDNGNIYIDGKKVKIKNISQAIKYGIAMISENRRDEGIIPQLSVKANLILVAYTRVSYIGFLINKKINALVNDFISKLNIKVSSSMQKISNLSGGNQQKVIISRWLAKNPRILICDEPTKGIDVGAKSEIHSMIVDLAIKGISVLLISSELPEILSICDRVIVMKKGRITGELTFEEATEEKIMRYATA